MTKQERSLSFGKDDQGEALHPRAEEYTRLSEQFMSDARTFGVTSAVTILFDPITGEPEQLVMQTSDESELL